jgi:hypothetical protein
MKTKQVEFIPPKEVAMPEGITEGEDFDLVCTFRMKSGGVVCMTKMGDADMPGYESKGQRARPESKPDYSAMADSMQQAGQPGMA